MDEAELNQIGKISRWCMHGFLTTFRIMIVRFSVHSGFVHVRFENGKGNIMRQARRALTSSLISVPRSHSECGGGYKQDQYTEVTQNLLTSSSRCLREMNVTLFLTDSC